MLLGLAATAVPASIALCPPHTCLRQGWRGRWRRLRRQWGKRSQWRGKQRSAAAKRSGTATAAAGAATPAAAVRTHEAATIEVESASRSSDDSAAAIRRSGCGRTHARSQTQERSKHPDEVTRRGRGQACNAGERPSIPGRGRSPLALSMTAGPLRPVVSNQVMTGDQLPADLCRRSSAAPWIACVRNGASATLGSMLSS